MLALSSAVTATGASALDHHGHHGAPERLNATAYYGSFDGLARQTNGLKAKFTEVDGTPVAGLFVKFTVAGEKAFLCDATTDTNGYAECKNSPLPPRPAPAVKLLTGGYDATLDGNDQYAPVTAHNSVGIDIHRRPTSGHERIHRRAATTVTVPWKTYARLSKRVATARKSLRALDRALDFV